MVKFWNNEGEQIVTMTDRDNLEAVVTELEGKLEKHVVDALYDTPDFMAPIDEDPDSHLADIAEVEHVEKTFEEYLSELKEWGKDIPPIVEE